MEDQVAKDAPIPFTELRKADKNRRLYEAMKIICIETDREHINKTLGQKRNKRALPLMAWRKSIFQVLIFL